ncbi:MAG TPA: hypothetical protein DCM05_15575 [Elusimicrobia bacterium]|nr:hypothetical protein [Elusimicrobiota bacterium]
MTRRILKRFSPRKGFTLVELIVVVLIVGVLAAFGIPQYTRTIETSKAEDAASIVKIIGMANRMFYIDKNSYASGKLKNNCINNTCTGTDACALIGCRYLASMDWDGKPYEFQAVGNTTNPCGHCGSSNIIACAKRCNGPSPCTTNSKYTTWCYGMNKDGVMDYYKDTEPKAPKPSS